MSVATLNFSWDSTVSALMAEQNALAAVSNNTANASTPGYTEETVQFTQAPSLVSAGISLGTGVSASAPLSQRDRVLNEAVDQQVQAQAASTIRLSGLQNLQSVFSADLSTSPDGSTSSGISGGLSALFSAFQQLAASPSDSSARQNVLSAAEQLADAFNGVAAALEQQQSTINSQVGSTIASINGLSAALARLNQQIASAAPNSDAGTLEDQRQYDLGQLSQLVGIDQITTNDNGIAVTTMGGASLVNGSEAQALTIGNSGGVAHIYEGDIDITSSLSGGEGQLGGMLQVRDADIPSAVSAIDALANAVGSSINSLNEAGTDLNGNAGQAIFDLPSGVTGSAAQISVAITDPSLLAAAQAGTGAGDGTNASALANLGQTALLGAPNPAAYLSSFIASVGDETSNVEIENKVQSASLTQLQTQQSALSSVSLDTEATNLQNLEQAYQAASKVFSIINQLMASAINLGTETTVS